MKCSEWKKNAQPSHQFLTQRQLSGSSFQDLAQLPMQYPINIPSIYLMPMCPNKPKQQTHQWPIGCSAVTCTVELTLSRSVNKVFF